MEASGISGHHSWRDADPRSAEPCRRLSDRARGRWNRLVQTDAGVGGCDAYDDLVRKRRRISVWISPRRDGFTALRSYFAGKEAVPLRTYLFRRKLDAPAATQGTAHRFRIDLNIRRDPWQGAAPAPGGGVSDLEWLLLGECGLTIAIALLTAFGRIQFGEGQAFAGRYQTPAMIYWAALGSLLLLLAYEKRPSRFHVVQAMLLGGMLASVLTFPGIWGSTTARADELRIACRAVMGPQFDVHAASKLYENTTVVKEGREFLRRKWRTARK